MSVQQFDFEYRVRWKLGGAHYHCRLFSRKRDQSTWANCGEMCLSAYEWVSFMTAFAGAEFLEDGS